MRQPAKMIRTIVFAFLVLGTLCGAPLAEDERELYDRKCGRCHVAYDPTEYKAQDWPGIIHSMKAKAALTPSEIEDLNDYLTAAAEDADEPGAEGPTVGGYLYSEYFESPERTKNYDIHYLAIHLSGRAAENIAYFGEFELEHGGKGDNVFIEQAYIDYWFLPNLALKVGAILTPFNRFDDFHEPLANYTITRPQSARAIGVSAWKDVGASLHGYLRVHDQASVGFDAYTINGLGSGADLRSSRQYRDNNEDKAFGGRIHVTFGDVVEIGGSAYHGAWDDEGDLDLNLFGGHLLVHTPVVDIYGEYAEASSENPAGVDDGDISGFFVQATRLIGSRFRPTIRYGKIDYLDRGTEFGRDSAKGNLDVSELIVAFAWYPVPRVAFKAEYAFVMEGDRVTERDNDQIGLQAAIRF